MLDVSAAFEDLSLCAQYFSFWNREFSGRELNGDQVETTTFDVPEDPVERKTKSSNMGKEVNTPVLLQRHVSLERVIKK